MTDTPTERRAESIWTRLRRRKVVQWGIAYVAGAWGLLQGLEYVADTFDWPESVQQIATLALLIGLPDRAGPRLVPRRPRRAARQRHRARDPHAAVPGRRRALLALRRAARRLTCESTAAQPASSQRRRPTAPAPDEKSIAVLPFVDMSAEKDQEYMADGIAEELLNLLAQVPDLKVIARTSSFAFKGKKIEIAEIAKKLNVAHVLEGSVRTSGNKLRITAQLIRTADSTHLWSETYDRPLDDIFAVQDEIANAIVQALQIKLDGWRVESPEGRHPEPRGVPVVPAGRECCEPEHQVVAGRRRRIRGTSDQTRPELWQGVVAAGVNRH